MIPTFCVRFFALGCRYLVYLVFVWLAFALHRKLLENRVRMRYSSSVVYNTNNEVPVAVQVNNNLTEELYYHVHNDTEEIQLIVLVHGSNGNATDMGLLKESLEEEIVLARSNHPEKLSSNTQFVIHLATSNQNDGNSDDGIEAGGNRLAHEVHQLIQQLSSDSTFQQKDIPITLSVTGYSIGGLWARYALRQLHEWHGGPHNSDFRQVGFGVFSTIACSNLGQQDYTYIYMPPVVSHALSILLGDHRSYDDLFGVGSDVVQRMGLDTDFVIPLRRFSKRIAYGSAFGADLIVSTKTSLFLAGGDSVHKSVESSSLPPPEEEESSLVALAVETSQRADTKLLLSRSSLRKIVDSPHGNSRHGSAVTREMARRLDSMGWTKVFVDFRSFIPSIATTRRDEEEETTRDCWTSSELCSRFCRDKTTLYDPRIAHAMIVRFAPFSRIFARNVIDGLLSDG